MSSHARLDDLTNLARLIQTLNATLADIASVIGRPAQLGHVGEYIASVIFDIDLHPSAAVKGHDGLFTFASPLAGRNVNVKWGTLLQGILDLSPDAEVDDILVLTGPVGGASAKVMSRPWVISSVYLFDARELIGSLRTAGVGVGIASSVRKHLWEAAMIYPAASNPRLIVTDEQRALLSLFAPTPVAMATPR